MGGPCGGIIPWGGSPAIKPCGFCWGGGPIAGGAAKKKKKKEENYLGNIYVSCLKIFSNFSDILGIQRPYTNYYDLRAL